MQTTKIGAYYDYFATHGYSQLAADPKRYPFSWVVPQLLQKHKLVQAGKTVLDLACGTGILKDYTKYSHYIGVDLSEQMLLEAKKRGYQEIIEANLLDYLPEMETNSVDVVIFFSAAYFLSSPELERVLAEIYRIAKVGWLITFDGISPALDVYNQKEYQIALYNHFGHPICGEVERIITSGWKSPLAENNVQMEIVLGLNPNATSLNEAQV